MLAIRSFFELMCDLPQIDDFCFHFMPMDDWEEAADELREEIDDARKFLKTVPTELGLSTRNGVSILKQAQRAVKQRKIRHESIL